MIKNMNSKMTTNSQLSTSNLKKQKQKQTKQTTRIGTEPQKWRSHADVIFLWNRLSKVTGPIFNLNCFTLKGYNSLYKHQQCMKKLPPSHIPLTIVHVHGLYM